MCFFFHIDIWALSTFFKLPFSNKTFAYSINMWFAEADCAGWLCGLGHEQALTPSAAQPLINAQEIWLLRRQKIALHNKRATI